GPSCGNLIDVGGCFAEHLVTESLNVPVMAPDSQSFAVDTDDVTHHSFSIEFFKTATGDLTLTRDVPGGVSGFAITNDRVAVVSLDGTVTLASSTDPLDNGTELNVPTVGIGCTWSPSFTND